MVQKLKCVEVKADSADVIWSKDNKEEKSPSWSPLLRQILISSCVWISYFTEGLCLGAPTVIIPQLRREANTTDAVSPEMASWLCMSLSKLRAYDVRASIHGYASLPWFFLPILAGRIGRKYPFLIVCITTLINFVVMFCSNTPQQLLIADIFQGPLFACFITISIFIISEYSAPKYRGLFLTIKSAFSFWGIWVANVLGTFFHWRTIAILGIACSVYNVLATLFWCESPSWLASKHRYEDCAKAQKWIKGDDLESMKELENLIRSCMERKVKQNEDKHLSLFTKVRRTLVDKTFYKPILLSMACYSLFYISGKLACTVYAIDIIKEITSEESTAYIGMIVLDGVTVAGMYTGSISSKYLKRRTLLFIGSMGGISFLFILSFYLFLVKLMICNENKYISLTLLTFFLLFISVGPMILSSSIYGELIPLKHRTSGMFLTGIYSVILLATSLKTAPLVFETFDMYGGFLFYASVSSFLIFLLFKYLPETKDKSLQEIENFFVTQRLEPVTIIKHEGSELT